MILCKEFEDKLADECNLNAMICYHDIKGYYRSVVETRKEMVSRIVLARLNETNHLDNLQFLEEIKNDEQQVLRFNACLMSLIEITYITDSNLTYEDALKRFVGWLPNSGMRGSEFIHLTSNKSTSFADECSPSTTIPIKRTLSDGGQWHWLYIVFSHSAISSEFLDLAHFVLSQQGPVVVPAVSKLLQHPSYTINSRWWKVGGGRMREFGCRKLTNTQLARAPHIRHFLYSKFGTAPSRDRRICRCKYHHLHDVSRSIILSSKSPNVDKFIVETVKPILIFQSFHKFAELRANNASIKMDLLIKLIQTFPLKLPDGYSVSHHVTLERADLSCFTPLLYVDDNKSLSDVVPIIVYDMDYQSVKNNWIEIKTRKIHPPLIVTYRPLGNNIASSSFDFVTTTGKAVINIKPRFTPGEYNTLRANDSLEDEEFWIFEDEDIGKAFWQVCIDLAVTRANLSTQEVESPDQEGNSFTQNSSLAEPPHGFVIVILNASRRDRNKIEDTADRCAIEGERSAGEDDG
ncbi:hypothetical protein APICC_02352 [Apis cerana cerana]|uniref:Uncharacterized protein n=1 Tax=Apis cerana cerana TaxID=94128 RepID=A0A2A3ESC5_APICC|nr:hypothetical protein APICC_02352 [Apis cerana cerana]